MTRFRRLATSGRDLPPGVDDVIATATAKDPRLRFRDVLSLADAFRNALPTASVTAAAAAPALEARNPYKGLRPFVEADADDFYGREAFVERLLKRWRRSGPQGRFLAVVGPERERQVIRDPGRAGARLSAAAGSRDRRAGSSPTSFPAGTRWRNWRPRCCGSPRNHPPASSRSWSPALAGCSRRWTASCPKDSELILVVDQFEEVFTLTEDEGERALLLESLRVAAVDPASRVRVVATLRADFYDRPLIYPRFGELLGRNTEVVTPLAPDELERAIVRPASSVGQTVEPALVAQVASDVAEQPGGPAARAVRAHRAVRSPAGGTPHARGVPRRSAASAAPSPPAPSTCSRRGSSAAATPFASSS